MAAASRLLLLPNELLVKILACVDYKHLMALQLTCHSLRTVILKSVMLQYTLELAAAGMRDGTSLEFTASEKREMLKFYQGAWTELAWQTRSQLPPVSPLGRPSFVASGNLLAYQTHDVEDKTDISVIHLPSVLRKQEYRQWKLDFDFRTLAFEMDSSQDLLLVATTDTSGPHHACIHLFAISTGTPHVSAANAGFFALRDCHFLHTPKMEICGDFIAFSVDSTENVKKVMIWNWKTGVLAAETALPQVPVFSLTSPPPFTFLDSSHILAISYSRDVGTPMACLQVYRFRALPSDEHTTSFESGDPWTMLLVCEFDFHELGLGKRTKAIWIQQNHAPHRSSDPQIHAPFSTDPSDRLFVVAVFPSATSGVQGPYNIIIPYRTFAHHINVRGIKRPIKIPLSDWITHSHVRWITNHDGTIGSSYIYGMRIFHVWKLLGSDDTSLRVISIDYHHGRVARSSITATGAERDQANTLQNAFDTQFPLQTSKLPHFVHEVDIPEDLRTGLHTSLWVLPCEDNVVIFRSSVTPDAHVQTGIYLLTF